MNQQCPTCRQYTFDGVYCGNQTCPKYGVPQDTTGDVFGGGGAATPQSTPGSYSQSPPPVSHYQQPYVAPQQQVRSSSTIAITFNNVVAFCFTFGLFVVMLIVGFVLGQVMMGLLPFGMPLTLMSVSLGVFYLVVMGPQIWTRTNQSLGQAFSGFFKSTGEIIVLVVVWAFIMPGSVFGARFLTVYLPLPPTLIQVALLLALTLVFALLLWDRERDETMLSPGTRRILKAIVILMILGMLFFMLFYNLIT